jgi:hypothetical protein
MDVGGTGVFPQIVIVVIITAAIYILYMTSEQAYKIWVGYSSVKVPILTVTSSSSGGPKIFTQDPNNSQSKNYLPLNTSENQLTGIEFSYSTFVYINSDTDDGDDGYRTLFYKGYANSLFPLMSPGVFVSSGSRTSGNSSPTLRIMMNTYDSWFNPIDIDQIPYNKWFHLAMVVRSNAIEVYINGNMAKKHSFKGTLPYQNYQPLVLFPNSSASGQKLTIDNTSGSDINIMGVPPGESMNIKGKFSGYLSNMFYYAYAMSYSEIQAALTLGPSSTFDSSNMDMPPYLIDSWWTQKRA